MSSHMQIPRNQGILHFARLQSQTLKESMIFEAKLEAGLLAGKSNHTPALLALLSHEPENLQIGLQTPCFSKKKFLRQCLRWP